MFWHITNSLFRKILLSATKFGYLCTYIELFCTRNTAIVSFKNGYKALKFQCFDAGKIFFA